MKQKSSAESIFFSMKESSLSGPVSALILSIGLATTFQLYKSEQNVIGKQSRGTLIAVSGVGLSTFFAFFSWLLLKEREKTQRVLKNMRAKIIESKNDIILIKQELHSLLSVLPDMLFELGMDGRYYPYSFPQASGFVPLPEEFVGKTVHDILPKNAADICMIALEEARKNGLSREKQINMELPQGSLWYEMYIARKARPQELEPRFVVTFRNITARKQEETRKQEIKKFSELPKPQETLRSKIIAYEKR